MSVSVGLRPESKTRQYELPLFFYEYVERQVSVIPVQSPVSEPEIPAPIGDIRDGIDLGERWWLGKDYISEKAYSNLMAYKDGKR